MTFVDPLPAQLQALASGDLAEPIAMLNLLKFHGEARDGSGRTGAQAYNAYGETAMRCIAESGGHIIVAGPAHETLIGPVGEHWDMMVLVFYPSRQAFLDMVARPDYQAAIPHRTAGLKDTRVVPVSAAGYVASIPA